MRRLSIFFALFLVFALLFSACAEADGNRERVIGSNGSVLPETGSSGDDGLNEDGGIDARANLNGNGNDDDGSDEYDAGDNDNANDGQDEGDNQDEGAGGYANGNDGEDENLDQNEANGPTFARLSRSDSLYTYTIETPEGENIGEVDSLLVHPESGHILYVIVDVENDLNLENDFVAIPWEALQVVNGDDFEDADDLDDPDDQDGDDEGEDDDEDGKPGKGPKDKEDKPGKGPKDYDNQPGRGSNDQDGEFDDQVAIVFVHDEAVLAGAPSFSADELNALGEESPMGKVEEFWDDARGQGQPYVRLNGDPIELVDRDSNGLGTLHGWIFDLPQGRVAYAVVQVSDFLDNEYVLVPYNRLAWIEEDGNLRVSLNGNPEKLKKAPRYENLEDVPGFDEDGWDADLDAYWGKDE